MTKQTRGKFSAGFKVKVALEAVKDQKTPAELSQQYKVNVVTISNWNAEFLENMAIVFEHGRENKSTQGTPELDEFYLQIGQLKVNNDFLKKVPGDLGYQAKNGNDPATAQKPVD